MMLNKNGLLRGLALASLIGFAASPTEASQPKWRTSYAEAVKESNKTGKPILMQVTADWCGFCHKMLGETFKDDATVEHVNECFIPLQLDADIDPELVQKLHVKGLPSTIVIAPDLRILNRMSGYKAPQAFDTMLSDVYRRFVTEQTEQEGKVEPGCLSCGYVSEDVH